MICFDNERHALAIGHASGASYQPGFDRCISHADAQGNVLGGVLYKDYTGVSCALHIAGFHPRWVNKDMLWVCFHYPFVQMKCETLFGQVRESNTKALEFDIKLGFSPTYRIKDVYPDGDMILLTMKRQDCRWLKLKPPVGFEETV